MTHQDDPRDLIYEFSPQICLKTLIHKNEQKNDLTAWPARITHEFDPRQSRDLAHSCISFLGRSHVMHPEEMKAKYMQKYVWKSFFNKPASWNPSTEVRTTFFKDIFRDFD